MHTFAQKQKPTPQAKSSLSAKSSRPHFGQSHEVSSILQLQRTIGNQAVQRLLQANAEELEADSTIAVSTRFAHDFSRIPLHANARAQIQPKLTISRPGDIYEQEADRVADQVMRMREPNPQHSYPYGGGYTKRQTEQLGHKHELLQTRYIQRRDASGTVALPNLNGVLRSHGRSLDPATRAFFEPRFGHGFSQVRIHKDSAAAAAAKVVRAKAFTVGKNIVFASGQYSPVSREGQRLLAHELTHVLQQTNVRGVTPTSGPKLQRQQPMDPRHARGYAGEQGMGFGLYRAEDDWVFIRGPSGSQGHGVTTSGEDGLAYNVRTKELHIIDNKSLARPGNVGSATAIDPQKNLLQNLDEMIRHVESQPPDRLPYRQRVLRVLRQTRAALRQGGRIPGRVKLVVTNVGGRSTGVTRRLAQQGVTFRDVGDPTDVPGTRRPRLEAGSQNPPAAAAPPTHGVPASPSAAAVPGVAKPATPAIVRQQARLMATLQKQVSQSARQAARARTFANSVGKLLEGLAVINSISDAMSIAAHGTTMPEVEKQANQVVAESKSAVAFAESVAANTSLLEAVVSVSDASRRGDADTLMDLSIVLSDFEDEIEPIGEKYQEMATQLEARAKVLALLAELMWKAAHIPSGATTAGQASALAMHISLQRLAGRLNTAAKNYRKAADSLLFRSKFIGDLGHQANRESWSLWYAHVTKALQQRLREREAQKRRREAARKARQPPPQVEKPKPRMSLWDRGQRALGQARGVLQMGEAASSEEKKAARDELWAVVGRIEQQQKTGFAHTEEEGTMRNLKGQLLKEIGRLMDAGP